MKMNKIHKVLTIAGSDCSGGAGIQADIKTISALGAYAASAITAITAQNTLGVQDVLPIPPSMVTAQIDSIMTDIEIDAVKIGMVNDASIVEVIVSGIKKYKPKYVVCDPVMISTSGCRLMEENTVDIIKQTLFPLSTVITPNLHEVSLLVGREVTDLEEMKIAAKELSLKYGTNVLVKGGHLDGEEMCDVLFADNQYYMFSGEKIETKNLHGTGCTLSSAIATYLCRVENLPEAVRLSKEYVSKAIKLGVDLNVGHGNGPVWHLHTLS